MSTNTVNYDTPEGMLTVTMGLDAGVPIDAINAACVRARSVILLLQGEFEDNDQRSSNAVILGALWAVEGMIEQIGKLVEHAYQSTHPSNQHGGSQ